MKDQPELDETVTKCTKCGCERFRIYYSTGYKQCQNCLEKYPIYKIIKHQR